MSTIKNAKLLEICTPHELSQGMQAFQEGRGTLGLWLLDSIDHGALTPDRVGPVSEACLTAYYESIRLGNEAYDVVAPLYHRERARAAVRHVGATALSTSRKVAAGILEGWKHIGNGLL